MKTPVSRITLFAFMAVALSPFAHANNEPFPDPGRTYDVSFAENARQNSGQIKVIRKGEGSWIFVEYTTQDRLIVVPRGIPGKPRPASEELKLKKITKKLWINTQWIVTASEPEADGDAANKVKAGQVLQLEIQNIAKPAKENIDGLYPVSLEGDINLPLIGSIKVVGMTIEETEQTIEDTYKNANLYKNPDVKLKVTK